MVVEGVNESQILEELQSLEPEKWAEVRDFIRYLKHRAGLESQAAETDDFTACERLQSDLIGLWANREEVRQGLLFTRQLHPQAGQQDDGKGDTPYSTANHIGS